MSLNSQRVAELPKDVKGIIYGFGQAGILGVVISPQSTRPPQHVFHEDKLCGYRSNGVPVYEGIYQDSTGPRKERFIRPNTQHPPEVKPDLT